METIDILVVEDEPATADTVRLYLERAGYRAIVARSGTEALRLARATSPRLVVLDLMLPELDGLSVCQRLRAESEARVIMLTARTTEDDRVRGLDLGADDYVGKPFSPRELVARVGAVLRRAAPADNDGPRRLVHHGLALDLDAGEADVEGRVCRLTPTEQEILRTLMAAPGRLFSRQELIERALPLDSEASERTVDAHVNNLRAKIEPDRRRPRYLLTVFGRGYRLGDGVGR